MLPDILLVSVESRKGGVGKTTAALNLASLLLQEHKRAVLFLDADITGTDATCSLGSSFWKDTTHTIAMVGSEEGGTSRANLLDIFLKYLMVGKAVPQFRLADHPASDGGLTISLDQINVLGSQVYNLADHEPSGGKHCLCKPTVLFDELNAFWWVEFLQMLCQEFIRAINRHCPNRHIAVVIDNSPGYVGLAPAIHEWFTDLGPDTAKFLTVSSLDVQDLTACGHAIASLHRQYCAKWNTGCQFAASLGGQAVADCTAAQCTDESFLRRLAETYRDASSRREDRTARYDVSGQSLLFYHSKGPGHSANRKIRCYQGLIVNRVPDPIKKQTQFYDIASVLEPWPKSVRSLTQDLLELRNGSFTRRMIRYDEYIEYQYTQQLVSHRVPHLGRRRQRFLEFLSQNLGRLRTALPNGLAMDLAECNAEAIGETILRASHSLQIASDVVIDTVRLLNQYGFPHLRRLLRDEWLPIGIRWDFQLAIKQVMPDSDLLARDLSNETWGLVLTANEMGGIVQRLIESAQQYVHVETKRPAPDMLAVLAGSLAALLALSEWQWSRPALDDLLRILGAIAGVEASRLQSARQQKQRTADVAMILAGDRLSEQDENLLAKRPIPSSVLEPGALPRLYEACARAQARILDLRADTEFLIAMIRQMVLQERGEDLNLPYIADIAEQVIVAKGVSHEKGLRQVGKGFRSAEYMHEFMDVLRSIVSSWEDPG